jgi:glutaredoxin
MPHAPTVDTPTDPSAAATGERAVLYRMVMPDHLCPSGLKAASLLRRRGYDLDDRPLRDRAAVDAFKARHGVGTTPQAWIDGARVGGYDDLRARLTGWDPATPTYRPVLILFAVAAATALALSVGLLGEIGWRTLGWFVSISMILLGMQKLRDVDSFVSGFLSYDLLARRWVPYAYAYPWIETGAGVLMTGMLLTWLAAPAALIVSTVGAVSVFKAVYLDRRELRCACVGGGMNVPLGFVSLTENLMMMGMSLTMLALLIV